jgi:lactoylglutathione lyase
MLKKLSHASFGSTDLPRTIDFYVTKLGCRIAHEFKNAGGETYGVFLASGEGTFIEFFRETSPPPNGGLFRHICFEVDDIEAMAVYCRSLGFEVNVRRGRTDCVLQFFIHDPDGSMIEFQQHDEESVLLNFAR